MKRTYRVVVAKPGLDGHDRGAKTITRALRDHGFEVIYTGLHQTPEQIAETVLQEDADAVGLSLLSGAHLTLFPRVMEELRARDLGDILVFGGGVIPDADARALRGQGVAEIFGPGSSLKAISAWLEEQFCAPLPFVRAMPNTPALVGEGCTGVCYGSRVTPEMKEKTAAVLDSFGKTVELPERLMDVLTGVSGREELSRPFAFTLELVAELSTTVAPADIVGQGVAWTIAYPDEAPRKFHGVVRRLTAGDAEPT